MLTLLGTLLGLIGALIPELIKLWQDKRDKAHELEILKLQMQQAARASGDRLSEIETRGIERSMESLYAGMKTGIRWVDALNGTVRPVVTYAFVILYLATKAYYMHQELYWSVWNEEDAAIFATVLSFYFGGRMFKRK